MFCPQCAASISPEDRYCPVCYKLIHYPPDPSEAAPATHPTSPAHSISTPRPFPEVRHPSPLNPDLSERT